VNTVHVQAKYDNKADVYDVRTLTHCR